MAENECIVELEQLIEKTTKNLDKGFHNVRYKLESPTDAFYLSSMVFVNIIANYGNEEQKRSIRLVVKKPSPLVNVRIMMGSDAQFHNEILFYEKFAVGHKDVPVCYYMHEEPPVKSVLVLENIEERGFRMCQQRFNIPMDYTIAAIEELARFHAKGYVMKERRRSEFFDIVENIHENRFTNNSETSIQCIVDDTAIRSIEFLRERGHDKEFCAKMFPFFEDTYENVLLKCIAAEEPLATLCHGDFTVNNTFFKEEDGKVKAMFIDFAMIRYGSPVIDLSSYLCLHCPETLDKDLIESILKAYNDSLMQCLEDNDMKNRERFSYEALREDYKMKGLFGYVVASFFLAVAMGKSNLSPEDFAEMDVNDRSGFLKTLGGDETTEILANMLLKLQEFGCLDHVL